MPKHHNLVDLDLLLIHETEKGLLVSNEDVEVWLPKSQVEYEKKSDRGLYTITMPEWLALEKKLI